MKRVNLFIRNFFIFSVLLVLCVASMGFYTIQANKEIRAADNWVTHTQGIIIETQQLMLGISRLISNQRGYLLFGETAYLERYEQEKAETFGQLERLETLVRDNPQQADRLESLEEDIEEYIEVLDEMLEMQPAQPHMMLPLDRQAVQELREGIFTKTQAMLSQEHALLNTRASRLESETRNYRNTLFIGGVASALLLLLLNAFLLKAQTGRTTAERTLKETEDRLALAIRGSNDGVFDWDLVSNKLYLSPQYKMMLGYADHELPASLKVLEDMIHPDDSQGFWETYTQYLEGNLSEFSHIFRMRHKAGRWVWVHARAKGLFNEEGKVIRFIGTNTDVTHIKDYERRLEEEKEKAEKANAAKSEFLAHMSHEIRTPLTAISGIAEILGNMQQGLEEKQRKLIQTLSSSATSLKDLIADILDFSRIESGEIEINNRQFPLSGLFEQVFNITSVRAREKQLHYTFDYEELAETHFYGDQVRLRQILINLIGNAIKFTDKGHVIVTAHIEEMDRMPVLIVKVEDTGIGIDKDALDIIFEQFRQADASVSRRYGGTGLGLPISKKLAELMNGTIKVDSVPGEGSTFTLYVPSVQLDSLGLVKNSHKTPVLADHKQQDRIKNILDEKKKILMVEDYEGNIVVLSHLLEEMGFQYNIARTGIEAIDQWKNNHYDLILMDVQMPEMDGLTATQTIRAMERERKLPQTPIIGLTAHALVADREKCIASGMNAYLPKPIDETELQKMIGLYIQKQPGDDSRAA